MDLMESSCDCAQANIDGFAQQQRSPCSIFSIIVASNDPAMYFAPCVDGIASQPQF